MTSDEGEEGVNGGNRDTQSSNAEHPSTHVSYSLPVLPAHLRPSAGPSFYSSQNASTVFSRRFLHLPDPNCLNSHLVVLPKEACHTISKDSQHPRRAKVVIREPESEESTGRWTRYATRAFSSRTQQRQWGKYWYDRESSSETSSSSVDSQTMGAEVERRKILRRKAAGVKGGGGRKGLMQVRRAMMNRASSSEEEEEEEEEGRVDTIDGYMGVEYEVASGPEETMMVFNPSQLRPVKQSKFWNKTSHYSSSSSAQSSRASSIPSDPLTSGISTLYEQLKAKKSRMEMLPTDGRRHNKSFKLKQRKAGGARLKAPRVEVTRLPKHTLENYKCFGMTAMKDGESVSTNVSAGTNHSSTKDISHYQSPSPCSDDSSGSTSMLVNLPFTNSTTSSSYHQRDHETLSVTTPRRSRQRNSPVARRSLPFSKPPKYSPTSSPSKHPILPGEDRNKLVSWSSDEDFQVSPSPFTVTTPCLSEMRPQVAKRGRGRGELGGEGGGRRKERWWGSSRKEWERKGRGEGVEGEGDRVEEEEEETVVLHRQTVQEKHLKGKTMASDTEEDQQKEDENVIASTEKPNSSSSRRNSLFQGLYATYIYSSVI